MAWELSSWLALIRTFQLLGALAGAALNGFVTVKIYIKDRKLLHNVVILELLICLALCYTAVALIVQHSRQRSRKPGWLICFLLFDLIACGMAISIVFFLSQAGLPAHCVGMAPPGSPPQADREELSYPNPFTTTHFSDEKEGRRGQLDKLCAFERSYFCIALGLIVTYIATVFLTAFRIRESKKGRFKSAKDSELQDDDLDLKTLDASSPLTSTPSPVLPSPVEQQQQHQQQQPPAPPSEGIITRNTSLRSTVTSSTASRGHGHSHSYLSSIYPAPPSEGVITRNTSIRSTMTSSTASHGGAPSSPYRGVMPSRRPVGHGHHHQSEFSKPPRPLISSPPARRPVPQPRQTPTYEGPSSASGMGGQGFVPIPLDDHDHDHDMEEEDFAGLMVADGLQNQERHQAQFNRQQRTHHMPMLPEDEQLAAEHALVSDGMRGGPSGSASGLSGSGLSESSSEDPMLPPYEPGPNRMPGHDGEDNEMRLSEYVKGQTRAQDMKDSGRY